MTITSIQLIILHPNLLPVTSHNGVICHVAHFLTSSWSLICISHSSYPLKYLLCLSSQSPQPTCTCEAGNLSSTFLALQHWEQEQLLAMTPTFRSTSSSLIGGNIVLLGAKWNWLEMGHQPPDLPNVTQSNKRPRAQLKWLNLYVTDHERCPILICSLFGIDIQRLLFYKLWNSKKHKYDILKEWKCFHYD